MLDVAASATGAGLNELNSGDPAGCTGVLVKYLVGIG